MICCRYRFFFSPLCCPHTIPLSRSLRVCLPLTHDTHTQRHIDFNQFGIVLCSAPCVYFLCSRFCIYINICSSLPFSFCHSHSVSCFLSHNILTLCVVLLEICANPIKMALFGFILKRHKERNSSLNGIFNINRINEFEFYRTLSFVVKEKKKTVGVPSGIREKIELCVVGCVCYSLCASPPHFHFAFFHVSFHSAV